MRDMTHQTSQRTSPPTPLVRASLSVITPCDVDRMAMPSPLRTRGTCLAGPSVGWPGRDTRRMPVIALPDPVRPSYRSVSLSMPCLLSSTAVTPWTKPSSRRISASRSLMFERGHSTSCLRARMPLRMRARKSAMGSVIDMIYFLRFLSPARLDDARDVAPQGELAEAKPAHLELAEIRARPAATLAAALDAHLVRELLG